MATQSSAAVFCRATVMLACLVAIPLLAVSGGSLPPNLRGLVAEYWPAAVPGPSFAEPESGEPPRFQPTSAASITPLPIPDGWGEQPQPSSPAAAEPEPHTHSPAAPNRVVPVGFEAPVPFPSESAATGPGGTLNAPPTAGARGSGQVQPVQASSPRPPASTSDSFTAMQARLQELGATYVLLESMGNRQEVYRCYCRMAIGNDPSYAYYFEAVDSAPLEAMARVVRQVEQWRAGRP